MKLYAAAITMACSIALPIAAHALPAAAKTPAKGSPVALAPNGLIIPGPSGQGPQNLRFGTLRVRAVQMVSAALGVPAKIGFYPERGQGRAVDYVNFRGGFELSFVAGKFVGRTLDYGGDNRVRTANDFGIGATAQARRKAFPDLFIDPGSEEGGMGPGFTSDKWVNGWRDGDKQSSTVTSMYAGKTCIVE